MSNQQRLQFEKKYVNNYGSQVPFLLSLWTRKHQMTKYDW
jgi:hypothetical protein